jgi:hypothetical protein
LSLASSDLIPTFPVCFKVLQGEAQKSKKEKQESNRKKRDAEQRLQRIQHKLTIVRTAPPVSQLIGSDSDEDGNHEKVGKWQIRYKERNRGMKAGFEQHVRCKMATGATVRQVIDGLLLDANFMLSESDAATFCDGMPQLRWFQVQREALGV